MTCLPACLPQAIISAINRARLPEPAASEGGEGSRAGGLQRDEEWLFQRLRQLKVLLVLDHIEELQASQDSLDLKVFLRQLFDQTRAVKVSQPGRRGWPSNMITGLQCRSIAWVIMSQSTGPAASRSHRLPAAAACVCVRCW